MLGRDAVVIVSTNIEQKRNSDVTYPFRPDSNFWYLTGFTEPDAIAVFSKESYVMFLRPKDETKEIWNGIRLGVELAPADNPLPTTEPAFLLERITVYPLCVLPLGEVVGES